MVEVGLVGCPANARMMLCMAACDAKEQSRTNKSHRVESISSAFISSIPIVRGFVYEAEIRNELPLVSIYLNVLALYPMLHDDYYFKR